MRTNESGIALILVLGLMAILGCIVASAVYLSQQVSVSLNFWHETSLSYYNAESIGNKTIAYYMADVRAYPSRILGENDNLEYSIERYMADGVAHIFEINDKQVSVQIFDALGGMDISNISNGSFLLQTLQTSANNKTTFNAMKKLESEILDYVDSDSFVHVNGCEDTGYLLQKKANLPRNGQLQNREEIRYIPAMQPILDSIDNNEDLFRVIAPRGMPPLIGRMNLYSVHPFWVKKICAFTDAEIDLYEYALQEWRNKKIPLNKNLPVDILNNLNIRFSNTESGCCTVLLKITINEYNCIKLRFNLYMNTTSSNLVFYDFMFFL